MVIAVKVVRVRSVPCTLWESRDVNRNPVYAVTRKRGGQDVIPKADDWAPTRCAALKRCRSNLEVEELFHQCD